MKSTRRYEPATYGGPGFRPRERDHAAEIGGLWAACGVSAEWHPLRAVMLHRPGREMAFAEDPDEWLMLERPDLARMQAEADAIGAFYAGLGARVLWVRPEGEVTPNLVFQRDTSWMTPEGAVLARMGPQQRAGEERATAAALAREGIPLLASPRGTATLEGADALWLDPQTVLVGLGKRTNEQGFQLIARVAAELGAAAVALDLPGGVQHLLGVVNFVDEGVAAIWEGRTPPAIRELLRARGWRTLALPDGPEMRVGRAMNWVCLGPGAIVMPAGCPQAQARLEAEGIQVFTLDVTEHLKAGGGLGCITGIVHRAP